jgi:hypothetical protein
MRTAKDKANVPKRYYRPEMKRCPHCQGKLKRGPNFGTNIWSR